MIIEHLFFNLGIALLVTLIFKQGVFSSCTTVILASTYVPDLDHLFSSPLRHSLIGTILFGPSIHDGYFHNIGALVLYSLVVGILFLPVGQKWHYSALFAGIGFSGHLLEDALVYNPGYALLWPLSSTTTGIGLFTPYTKNFFGIANTTVLAFGILFVVLAIFLRGVVQWYTAHKVLNRSLH